MLQPVNWSAVCVPWHLKSPGSPRSTSPDASSTPRSHKFPLKNTPHVGVQVKVHLITIFRYSTSHRCMCQIYNSPPEPYKSTDIIEFAGILTSEPYVCSAYQCSFLAIFFQIYCRHRTASPDLCSHIACSVFNTYPGYNYPAMLPFHPNT